jgi:Zn-dependent protease with chaperone function
MLQQFVIYILKTTVYSGVLLGYYWVALRNKRFHHYNRFYLLLTVILSMTLPLLNLQLLSLQSDSDTAIGIYQVMYAGEIRGEAVTRSVRFSGQELLAGMFLIVTAIMLSLVMIKIVRLYKLKRRYPVIKTDEFIFIDSDLPQAPFSFLKNIFWRHDISLGEETGKQILQHEITHVKQKHTWDKLYIRTVLCFFWINPFYWLIERELYLIHEFIADQHAVADQDASAFASMLLQAQYGKVSFSPIQSFFHSPIKRRLLMFTTSTVVRFSYARRIIAIPVLAGVVLFSSFKLQRSDDPVAGITRNDTAIDRADARNPESSAVTVWDADTSDSVLYVIDGKIVNPSEVMSLAPGKIYSMTVLKGNDATKKYGDQGKNGVIEIKTKSEPAIIINEIIASGQPPSFPGGATGWQKYLEKNANVKSLLEKKAPSGRYSVVVSFHVDVEGNLSKVKALNDPGYGAASEAERVIANSGKWIPAVENGKKIAADTKQSVTFQIAK